MTIPPKFNYGVFANPIMGVKPVFMNGGMGEAYGTRDLTDEPVVPALPPLPQVGPLYRRYVLAGKGWGESGDGRG